MVNPIQSPKTTATPALSVRVSKSLVTLQPGDASYTIQVLDSTQPRHGYTGYLDANSTICPANNPVDGCTTSIKPFGNYYVNNGTIVINLPSNVPAGIYKSRFRPRGKTNWSWSNEIQVNVNTTTGLEAMTDYWIFPTSPTNFQGRNTIYDVGNLVTQIWGTKSSNLCGLGEGMVINFSKTSVFSYINQAVPWYNEIWSGTPNWGQDFDHFDFRFKRDFKWYVLDWQKKSGWLDSYNWSIGGEWSAMDTNQNPTVNVSLFGSLNKQYPGYVLSPKWIGEGWAAENKNETMVSRGPADICSGTKQPVISTQSYWGVTADFLTLTLPKYSGPSLRLKFIEANNDWLTGGLTLREDWWFIKGVGLVMVENKNFGPAYYAQDKKTLLRAVCNSDPDCLQNDAMANPNFRMIREDYCADLLA